MAKTRYVNKKNKKGKTRRVKRGGNKTDGDKLMDALHENSKIPDAISKIHSHEKIARMFNNVKENDLYHSILRKKKTLNSQEKDIKRTQVVFHEYPNVSLAIIAIVLTPFISWPIKWDFITLLP
jgi:hypothetical protein